MPMVQGYWSFKPLANGMVEVTMSGHADPGGRIPATAVNFLIQEHPYNTLKGLRKIIGEPSFKNCNMFIFVSCLNAVSCHYEG